MPHRTASRATLAALLAASLALPAGCASGGSSDDGSPQGDFSDRPAIPETGVRAGWIDFKPSNKPGRITNLTLLSEGSEEGRLLAAGKARMEGGKVVDDATAADLILAFEHAGFDRFSVQRMPNDPPPGAKAVVWIDRGRGFESLFLLPGVVQNPETQDLPKVYEGLTFLLLSVYGNTPGSTVTTGQGWSGDDLMNQQPGKGDR